MEQLLHTDGIELFYAPDRESWSNWLAANAQRAKAVWLVYYKKESNKPRVSYDDAVDEAIRYGWIDSKPNKLDELRSIQFFAPRKPKSNWSKLNKERVKRLNAEGRMTEAGLAAVNAAKTNGAWDALNEVEELIVPEDLLKELQKNTDALKYFHAFPKSSKKNILEWIANARQPETRLNRIQETVSMAAENLYHLDI